VRVPRERFADGPRCAKCHNALFEDHPLELKTASFDKHITRSDLPVIVDFLGAVVRPIAARWLRTTKKLRAACSTRRASRK
jgi:hypothetical protein